MSLLPFAARVRRTVERFELLPPGSRAIVALSGGPDSVALLSVLRQLAPVRAFTVVGVAHLNHQLRGPAADQDEAFCVNLAATWGLPISTTRVDVAALARTERRSIEDAARLARYRFLEEAATELGADRIAVGHTRDDQAETLLLRLVRGAGPRGLAGIFPRAGRIVRPLLDVSRDDILDYLNAEAIDYRHDASNDDLTFARNRIRHELLPILRKTYSRRIVRQLARSAELFRADAELLDHLAAQAYARVARTEGDEVAISVTDLRREPFALQRRLILMGLKAVAPNRFNGFDQVEQVLTLAQARGARGLDVSGVRVERQGPDLVFRFRSGRQVLPRNRPAPRLRQSAEALRAKAEGGSHEGGSHEEHGRGEPCPPDPSGGFCYSLAIPGEVSVPEAACAVTAESASAATLSPQIELRNRGDTAVVDADELSGGLIVRSRKPGDRLRPLGLTGHKKLQDLFVDHKIARSRRDRVPVVVDARDRIVWVAGITIAEDFRVTSHSRDVVILKRRRLEALER